MEIVVVVGAIAVSVLAFLWLIRVVRATLKTALLVAFMLLGLQIFFGIGPATIWQQLQDWLPGTGSSAPGR
ncbi:MAG: hypothetical protein HC873_11330 [Leptolyngbyaceae cyanobacterium SL_1_1]|nr:hypothetical protein [Leptolyngbyaceae cyanobacterium RM1_1_2]NJO10140.1 hypothetical protein [Leptolyngbyaceae cyanobacterium SL_1_1]